MWDLLLTPKIDWTDLQLASSFHEFYIIQRYSKHKGRSRIEPTSTRVDMELEKEVVLSNALICYPLGFMM
jgi:hypothetical protein